MNGPPAMIDRDAFARSNGIEVIEMKPGAATARMTLTAQHLNGLGTVHGGAIFTLADMAFAAACNSHGFASVAINASISYMKAVSEGVLSARATEVSLNRRLAAYTVEVTTENGEVVAIFQGLAYRKGTTEHRTG